MNMDISQRKFIRLEEVSEKTTLTVGDVKDAIECGQLTLNAFVDLRKLGAISKGGATVSVEAVFDYRGMVKLPKKVSMDQQFTGKDLTLNSCYILEVGNVSNWQPVNSVFGNLEPLKLGFRLDKSAIPSKPFGAYTRLQSRPTAENVAGKFFNSLADNFTDFISEEAKHRCRSDFPIDNTHVLTNEAVQIEAERLRLDLDEIEAVFKGSVSSKKQERSSLKTLPNVITHPIEQIVYRVLSVDNHAKPKQIWEQIRKDVDNVGRNRKFDIDNLIDSMDADNLTWFGKGVNSVNEMGYEAFRKTIVYRARKGIADVSD
ncbi:hypothetical protein ACPV52_15335 [Vibrio astriarenae]